MVATNQIDRLDGLISSIAVKAPCDAVALVQTTLSGEQTVNLIAVTSGDRVLVTNQDIGSENGIYDVSTAGWTRSPDFDGNRDVVNGTLVTIQQASGQNLFYQVDTADPIVIGTTAISFIPILLDTDPSALAWEFVIFTGDRTLLLTDQFKMLRSNTVGGTQTVTIPPNSSVPFIRGTQISFEQGNTAVLDITEGSGVTLNTPGTKTLTSRYATATIIQKEIDDWVILGNI